MKATFRISNYRCFPNDHPAEIELRDGVTALVGVNNSGKSSLLRFFYEFRNLFVSIGDDPNQLVSALRGGNVTFEPMAHTIHPDNLVNYRNKAPITITMSVDWDSFSSQFGIASLDESQRELPKALVIEIAPSSFAWRARFLDRSSQPIALNDPKGITPDALQAIVESPERIPLVITAHYRHAFRTIGKSLYIPAFRHVLGHTGSRPYFDLTVGDQVIDRWDKLKNGHDPNAARKIKDATEMLRTIFGYSTLDIQANHDRSDFNVTIDGHRNLLSTIGSGFAQFFIVFCAFDNDPTGVYLYR